MWGGFPLGTLLQDVLDRLRGVGPSGIGHTAKCPAHDDRHASLSVALGDDGRVLLHCHAGCTVDAVCRAVGLTMADLFPGNNGSAVQRSTCTQFDARSWPKPVDAIAALEGTHGPSSNRWTYHDADGTPIGLVIRWDGSDGKKILPIAKLSGSWKLKAMQAPRPLYGIPAIVHAPHVYVVEGEKVVDALSALGLPATTSAGGANAAAKTDWTLLSGRNVTILPDADCPGRKYAEVVAKILSQLDSPSSAKILALPGLQPDSGDDAVEFIAARHAAGSDDQAIRAEIERLAESAPAWANKDAVPSGDRQSWEDPEPFGHFGLPPFPIDSLGTRGCRLAEFCEGVAESFQVPVDLPAMLALAVAGAALAKRCEVHVRADWWEPLNLFVVVVMEPGERKSAVFREITAPLVSFEAAECERLAPEIERNEVDRRLLAGALKHAERVAATSADAGKRDDARRRVDFTHHPTR